jgi:uncharacterized protein
VHVRTDRPLDAVAVAPGLGLHQPQAGVRHLLRQSGVHGTHQPALGLVLVTAAPGLAPDLARSGAVVVLTEPGDLLDPVALDRAVDDTGAADVLVLLSAGAGTAPPSGATARREVVEGLSEVQLVTAAATRAVAESAGVAASSDRPEAARSLAREVRRAVDDVRATEVPDVGPAGHDPLVDSVERLAAGRPEILTVVTAAGTPASAVRTVEDVARAASPSTEVVVLHGGAPGAGLTLGAEGGR